MFSVRMNTDMCKDDEFQKSHEEKEQMQAGEVASKFSKICLSSITSSGNKLERRKSTLTKLNPWTKFTRDEKVEDDPVQYYTTHVFSVCTCAVSGAVHAKTSDMYESVCRKQSESNGIMQPKYRGQEFLYFLHVL